MTCSLVHSTSAADIGIEWRVYLRWFFLRLCLCLAFIFVIHFPSLPYQYSYYDSASHGTPQSDEFFSNLQDINSANYAHLVLAAELSAG